MTLGRSALVLIGAVPCLFAAPLHAQQARRTGELRIGIAEGPGVSEVYYGLLQAEGTEVRLFLDESLFQRLGGWRWRSGRSQICRWPIGRPPSG